MSAHHKGTNGNDHAEVDERDAIVARARSEFQAFVSPIDANAVAFERASLAQAYTHRIGTVVIRTEEKVKSLDGRIDTIVELHAHSDALIDGQFERLTGSMAAAIVDLRERGDRIEEKLDLVIAHYQALEGELEEMKKRSPDDSMVDAYEAMTPEVAERVAASQREKHGMAQQIEKLVREARETELREEGRREEQERQEKADAKKKLADKESEERLKRRMGIIIAACGIVAILLGAIVGIWSFAAKHPPPPEFTAPALTK